MPDIGLKRDIVVRKSRKNTTMSLRKCDPRADGLVVGPTCPRPCRATRARRDDDQRRTWCSFLHARALVARGAPSQRHRRRYLHSRRDLPGKRARSDGALLAIWRIPEGLAAT